MFNFFKTKKDRAPNTVNTPVETSMGSSNSFGSKISTRATSALSAIGNTQAAGASDTSYNLYVTSSDLVYACMSFIADNVSQVRFKVGQIDRTSGIVTEAKDKKLTEMFNTYPNEYQTWTELLSQETLSLMVAGNSYTTFEKNAGKYEMWNLLPPQEIKPVIDDKNGMIKEYSFGRNTTYKRNEVVHNKLPSITSFHTGDPLLQPLLDQLTLEAYATDDLVQFYDNSSVGSTVLTSEQPLTQKQSDDLSNKISNEFSMKNKGRHKMFVLPNNLKPTALRLSPKDAMVLDALTIAEDRILQVFKLHKSILGGSSDTITYTHNMESLNEVVFNNAIRPYVNRLKDNLEAFFRRVTKNPDLVLIPDYSNLPEIHRAVLKHHETARALSVSGILSLNEARDILGVPRIQDADYANRHFIAQHLIGSNFVTIEELNKETVEQLRDINTPEETPKKSDDPEGGKPNQVNDEDK